MAAPSESPTPRGAGVERLDFAGSRPLVVREAAVRRHLDLGGAIAELRRVLEATAPEDAPNRPRVRLPGPRGEAWLHTLRARIGPLGVAGGKDYTSVGFATPAVWATVVDTETGELRALVEASHLSRLRTAAVCGLATDLLAPEDARCLVHFGAGRISEPLVRAVLAVRPGIERVVLVRRPPREGAPPKELPDWAPLPSGVDLRLGEASDAARADVATTATSSAEPVLTLSSCGPRLRHVNLMGSNGLSRREIDTALARRCLRRDALLVVDDRDQARAEAGDFSGLMWREPFRRAPTLAELVRDDDVRARARRAAFTAFESVGIGLMDLILATQVVARVEEELER